MAVLSALAVRILLPWELKMALDISAVWPINLRRAQRSTVENTDAGAGHGGVDSGRAVGAGGDQLSAHGVEVDIQDFVGVARERVHDLATADVPDLAGAVDGARYGVLACELELH